MSKRKKNCENYELYKQRKPDDVDLSNISTVDVKNQETPPAILKLNAICCDDLFDWLSLKDLHSLGQTCKRMHRLTGVYFQENFKETRLKYIPQNIYYKDIIWIHLNRFVQFVQKITFDNNGCIRNYNNKDYQYIGENCDSLRQITFKNVRLTKGMIDGIKVKLDKIERIDLCLYNSRISIKLYQDFLKFCPNLKSLCVNDYLKSDIEWIRHKYPKLECINIQRVNNNLYEYLGTFFQQNAQLKSLVTDHCFLLKNRDTLINSKIKLDFLHIKHPSYLVDELNQICILLNKLHDNGFYKRLELTAYSMCEPISQFQIDKIATLRGLEKFSCYLGRNSLLPTNVTLKELDICTTKSVNVSLLKTVISLPNLYRLNLCWTSMDELVTFISRLPKLKNLSIKHFMQPNFDSNQFHLDLQTLNMEREKLFGACKMTIYVEENVYLRTKKAPINIYAKHDLIEIKHMGLRCSELEFCGH